jgi:hypothetical protein
MRLVSMFNSLNILFFKTANICLWSEFAGIVEISFNTDPVMNNATKKAAGSARN